MRTKQVDSNQKYVSNLTHVVFLIYLILLVWLIIFKFDFALPQWRESSLNLIPFAESVQVNGQLELFELIANAIAFMPLGIYLMIYDFPNTIFKKILLAMFISVIFETAQFVCAIGASDITDVITNTTGAAFGMLIFMLLQYVFKERTEKACNLMFIALYVLFFILATILLLANM